MIFERLRKLDCIWISVASTVNAWLDLTKTYKKNDFFVAEIVYHLDQVEFQMS